MTDDPTPTPGSSSVPSVGDAPGGVDFGAIVASHNSARPSEGGAASGAAIPSARTGSTPRGREAPSSGGGAGGPRRSRADRSGWWRWGYPTVIALVVVLVVPVLVWTGLRAILDSSDGRLVKRVTDPTAPGYEAVLTKTPTAIVAMVAPDETLSGIAVLALTSDTSGGVLLLPPTISYSTTFGLVPVSVVWQAEGIDGLANSVGQVLDLSFGERLVIRSSEWSTLTSSAGTLTMTLPDPVKDAKDAIVLAKGSTTLTPDQVAIVIDSKGPKETELNRTLRQELLWKAWIDRLRSSGAQFPGPVSSGLGRFVAALSHGQVSVSSLPVAPLPPAPPLPQRYAAVEEPAAAAVAAIVPFPEGAPGGRPRLRVLDGTGRLGNGLTAAIQLNAGGGQVDVVGNAKSFGQQTTQILWYEGSSEAAAAAMKEALGGIGEIVKSNASNSASDITVTLGEDYLQKYGPSSDPTRTTVAVR